jgi:hypothetical protein
MHKFDPRRKFVIKNETRALYTDNSGNYTPIRELVVAVVTYGKSEDPRDWAAYQGFVPADMSIEQAVEIISDRGDKMYGPKARDLLKYTFGLEVLNDTYYRE